MNKAMRAQAKANGEADGDDDDANKSDDDEPMTPVRPHTPHDCPVQLVVSSVLGCGVGMQTCAGVLTTKLCRWLLLLCRPT